MSSEKAIQQQAKLDWLRGVTPESRRIREIKGGVITASVGLGLMLLLIVFMGGIIASGKVSDAAAEILSRLWIVGVLPFLIGMALIFNGMFISKRGELSTDETNAPDQLEAPPSENYLSPADTNDLETDGPFSVTDATTRHLQKTRSKG